MTTTYKIIVNDRNYNSWDILDEQCNKIEMQMQPIESKLFTNDIFTVTNEKEETTITITQSPIRSCLQIPGVLILDGNKTYGRQTCKKGVGKLFYKCIPDDTSLPPFLVPYQIKNIGFSKVFKNMYVTFVFDEWNDKHPKAKLDNVIGDVDSLEHFYEYQMFCKKLNISMQHFQKNTMKCLENVGDGVFELIKAKYPSIQDRTNQKTWKIITIDPPTSLDFDDACSIVHLEDGTQQLSIYISNVTIMLDVLQLWDSFSRRISTIYLPDRKRPMLPTILSDELCSLQENVTRVAFVMDIFIKNDDIIDIQYANCFVKVYKNFAYEEPKLLSNKTYTKLLAITRKISAKHKYIESIEDSHEMVCYLMIFMNYYCAKELAKNNTGVFRSTSMSISRSAVEREIIPETVPENIRKTLKIMRSTSGQYINGSSGGRRHEILDLDAYIHITSPIRRIVDILNMIKIQQLLGTDSLSENSDTFYNKWLNELDYINKTTRTIRRVQNECDLLNLCIQNDNVMQKEYNGYITEKTIKDNGYYQYTVFLPELKLSSTLLLESDIEIFEHKIFKLFLFTNEEKFKRKIRLHLV